MTIEECIEEAKEKLKREPPEVAVSAALLFVGHAINNHADETGEFLVRLGNCVLNAANGG